MNITSEMLQAGINRAVELGVLPRQDVPEDLATNREIMEEILRAALEPDSSRSAPPASRGDEDNGLLSQ